MDEKQLIDDLEKESMLELEVMHESENTDNERIIEDAKSKIEKLFDDLRDLLKDASDPEKVKEALSQAKDDAKDILSSTKDKVVEVSESEQFKQTVSAGKEFLQGTAGLVVDGFKYGKETLKDEYFRDLKANKPIHIPFNYFPDDDPEKEPILKWRSHANLLYRNWLNYVYQLTPFEIEEIGKIKEPIGTGSREDHGYAKTFTK